jgi:hypothetical protein
MLESDRRGCLNIGILPGTANGSEHAELLALAVEQFGTSMTANHRGKNMSNVIAFLETMGQDAELRHAGRAELYRELTEQHVDADAQWAILRGDCERLEALLGAPTIVCCSIDKGDEEEEEEEPSRDGDEISTYASLRCIASAA